MFCSIPFFGNCIIFLIAIPIWPLFANPSCLRNCVQIGDYKALNEFSINNALKEHKEHIILELPRILTCSCHNYNFLIFCPGHVDESAIRRSIREEEDKLWEKIVHIFEDSNNPYKSAVIIVDDIDHELHNPFRIRSQNLFEGAFDLVFNLDEEDFTEMFLSEFGISFEQRNNDEHIESDLSQFLPNNKKKHGTKMNNTFNRLMHEIKYNLSTSTPPPTMPSLSLSSTRASPHLFNVTRINENLNPSNCGISLSTRVLGGIEGKTGQFPWITRLGYVNTTSKELSYRCSGTIVNDQYVLTAAHCVTGLGSDLKLHHLLIGDKEIHLNCQEDTNLCTAQEMHRIDQVIIHELYDSLKHANDIALLRVAAPSDRQKVNFISICLPVTETVLDTKIVKGKTGVVAGWITNNDGIEIATASKVKYFRLPLVNLTDCASKYARYSEYFKNPITIDSTHLCAQGQPMNDVCQGDSGGPLMDDGMLDDQYHNEKGRYVLLGIVAFGPTLCGVSNLPGVYTRVSSFIDWILANTCSNK